MPIGWLRMLLRMSIDRGADALTMAVAARLERAAAQGFEVGGIACDFAMAFDLLPTQILFGAMDCRGASQRILKPLRYMYDNLQRLFRLRVVAGSGGPLSMACCRLMLCP